MKWEDREGSGNIEDRRGMGKKLAAGGGLAIIVMILAAVFGINPEMLQKFVGPLVNQQEGGHKDAAPPAKRSAAEERMAKFTSVVLRDTEVVWKDLFKKIGKTYDEPKLVLFTDRVESACGVADSGVGPFYCPGDNKVYIDLSFYVEMEKKLNIYGEFARAYVIAHEIGHHVQRLLGYSEQIDQLRRNRAPQAEINRASVRLELQADYLAGVWAHHAQKRFNFLEEGDLKSALNAAFEIGDDRLQKKARGVAVPHTFTHGTSEQRMRWFNEGFKTGDVNGAEKLLSKRYEDL